MTYSEQALKRLVREIRAKRLTPKAAFARLKHLPYESIHFARLDHHRPLRKGLPEAVYAPGKTFKQLESIVRAMTRSGHPVLITRLEEKIFRQLQGSVPRLRYAGHARLAYFNGAKTKRKGLVAIVTAGTSDIPVAEEARVTLEVMGHATCSMYDCGVAGLHRLLDVLPTLKQAKVIICVAGMEGALASVVAGLVNKPVVAVPTSVGYGASFRGIAPLLAMLNSCAQGVAVMNIDNGFGAACFASLVARRT